MFRFHNLIDRCETDHRSRRAPPVGRISNIQLSQSECRVSHGAVLNRVSDQFVRERSMRNKVCENSQASRADCRQCGLRLYTAYPFAHPRELFASVGQLLRHPDNPLRRLLSVRSSLRTCPVLCRCVCPVMQPSAISMRCVESHPVDRTRQ